MRNLYKNYTRRLPEVQGRLSAIMIVVFCGMMLLPSLPANAVNQRDPVITLDLKGATIKEALREIEKQTRYNFVINDNRIQAIQKTITISIKEKDIVAVLNKLLDGTDVTFKIRKYNITLIPPSDTSSMIPVADSGGRYFEIENDQAIYENFFREAAIVVSGTISDDKNSPLPGVNILVKGTTTGTVSDANGTFKIEVPSTDAVLIFSFIGYVTKEVPLNGQTELTIQLETDIKTLSEVVVVGYGTQRKSDLTGSVGSVKAEDLQQRPAASLNQALAGRIAGVQVNTNSGRPGGQTNVRIRGASSINTTNNPLYVVDGVIMPVGTQAAAGTAIDYINPNDIASVEVLKDASATAIYGARGANGVILISTKRGSAGGRVTYDSDYSMVTLGPNPNRVRPLNAREYLQVIERQYDNTMSKYDPTQSKRAYTDPRTLRSNPLLFDASGEPLYDTDWLKESSQQKLSQNHQLGFTGGNNESTYGLFLGYRNDNGLLLNSYLTRYSARFVIDNQIKPWLKVGGTLSYNNQEENIVDQGTGGGNSVRMIAEALPILPVKFPDGTWGDNLTAFFPGVTTIEKASNPVHIMTDRKFILQSQTTLGSIYSNITFLPGLDMKTVLGANILTQGNNQYNGRTLYGIADGQFGTAALANGRENFWSLENYLTYNKKVSDQHAFTGLLGISWQETNTYRMNVGIQNFTSDYFGFNNIGAGSATPSWGSNRARWAYNSYFARINYSFLEKYLLTLTGRADGSSKFGENHKFAFFPSAAVAWRLSEEEFLKNNSAISNLKLRASYGVSGNSESSTYGSLAGLASGNSSLGDYRGIINGQLVTGVGTGRLANPNLRWEKTASSDIGLEVGLFNDKIAFEADVYYRKTTDMLLDAPVPTTTGFNTIRKNIGSMENKGIELALTTSNIEKSNLSWTTSFNISLNRNKVLALATPADIRGVGGPNFLGGTGIIRVGEPVGSFFGLVRVGTWGTDEESQAAVYGKRPGDLKYLDTNSDGAINDADRRIIGNGYPKAWGSLLNTVRFMNFDFLIELQYSYGNDIFNMTKHSVEDRQGLANSMSSVLDAWTPANQNSMIAELRVQESGYDTNADSHWVEDGSFIRGRNILLGYNFSPSITDRLKLSRLRIYTSVQNFFLRTKYTGYDPEVISQTYGANNPFSQGITFFDYPKPTTFMLGLNVGL